MGVRALVRLTIANGRVTGEERYLGGQRIRDVQQGPDGLLYLVTDEDDGKLLRVVPRAR
jgi:glucose/arabinose dehydrogenase